MVRLGSVLLALGLAATEIAAQDFRVSNPGALAFSADGRLLRMVGVSAGDLAQDRYVSAVTLDAHTGEVLHIFNLRPNSTVLSTTADESEALIGYGASGDQAQRQLLVLDTATGKVEVLPASWSGSADEEVDARLSSDGRLISIYSETGADARPLVVSVYAWPEKTLVAKQASAYTNAGGIFGGGITSDGRAIEFDNNRSGSELVDLTTGRAMASFNPGAVRSPDGKWVIELMNRAFPEDDNKPVVITIKNGSDGKSLGKLDVTFSDEEPFLQLTGAFCGNSGRFVLASERTVGVYAIPSGKVIATFPAKTWQDTEADGGAALACSAAGTRVAILSGTRLTLHDVK